MAKKESYEETLVKLQEVLKSLEEEELNLDDSIKAYEEGTKLVNKLYKMLNTLEGKITVIKENTEKELGEENGN
ncbi:MAG: exodeoxyribonuclease VII small subunit [Clostridium sp.]|nr:exodeoxyribonuclease VII small subunit [Clostridium sp.]MDY3827835.1 exodeoxyribonuclease VII small subunit [Clostridium sp.]